MKIKIKKIKHTPIKTQTSLKRCVFNSYLKLDIVVAFKILLLLKHFFGHCVQISCCFFFLFWACFHKCF